MVVSRIVAVSAASVVVLGDVSVLLSCFLAAESALPVVALVVVLAGMCRIVVKECSASLASFVGSAMADSSCRLDSYGDASATIPTAIA